MDDADEQEHQQQSDEEDNGSGRSDLADEPGNADQMAGRGFSVGPRPLNKPSSFHYSTSVMQSLPREQHRDSAFGNSFNDRYVAEQNFKEAEDEEPLGTVMENETLRESE